MTINEKLAEFAHDFVKLTLEANGGDARVEWPSRSIKYDEQCLNRHHRLHLEGDAEEPHLAHTVMRGLFILFKQKAESEVQDCENCDDQAPNEQE